jgi:glycosyltransferase involved in cell wall biosynthesis
MEQKVYRPKVLMSAYACEPDRGSEPGVGWNWAMAMAEHADVTVVTRANNQEVIEKWVAGQDADSLEYFPEIIYYDPPKIFLIAKKKRLISVQAFYLVWQAGVSWFVRKRMNQFDLVHHVTFNSMMSPGYWWGRKIPVLLGPLGGTSCVRAEYKSLYGTTIWKENIRGFMIRNWSKLPWLRVSFNKANRILCANSETEALLSKKYSSKTGRMLETGVERKQMNWAADSAMADDSVLRVIWIGTIEPWKALTLAIRAAAKALSELDDDERIELHIIGAGSEHIQAELDAATLGLGKIANFHGILPVEDTQKMIRDSDVLLFSSIKDTSGNVILEAMCHGKPVICLNHQGAGDMTTPETAIRISPGTIADTVDGFSRAIIQLLRDPALRNQMGLAGFERVKGVYTWEKKSLQMLDYYEEVVKVK